MERFIPHMKPSFGQEEADSCYKYMMSGGYVTEFKYTRQLEKMIQDFTGAKHCVMVNNGTISLTLALLALNLQAGDEIIVPNLTMVASSNAAKLIGIKPILADITGETLTLDVDKIDKLLTPKTKAIMHVSLNGRCRDLKQLREFCNQKKLYLIEDAAQSLGSFYQDRHLGTFGHIGSFSFSSPKIISTGQGGALVTNDDDIARKIRRLKDFGRSEGGLHDYVGFGINSKFTDIQAVIGIEQMKKLQGRINRKREIWKLYYEELSDINGVKMLKSNDPEWTPWVIDIYVDNPDKLARHLKNRNIGTIRQYPVLQRSEKFSVSCLYSLRGLWLPAILDITDTEIMQICKYLKEYIDEDI